MKRMIAYFFTFWLTAMSVIPQTATATPSSSTHTQTSSTFSLKIAPSTPPIIATFGFWDNVMGFFKKAATIFLYVAAAVKGLSTVLKNVYH